MNAVSEAKDAVSVNSSYIKHYLSSLAHCLDVLDLDAIETAIRWIGEAGSGGNVVFTCGNGGSSSIASHFVADLVHGASQRGRIPFRAICLSDNTPTLTAIANDEDYEHVFVRPLMNLAVREDILFAISGSGNSANVLRAVEYAKDAGCRTIGLTTGKGGWLREIVDLPLEVNSAHFGRLEDTFLAVCHVLAFSFGDQTS